MCAGAFEELATVMSHSAAWPTVTTWSWGATEAGTCNEGVGAGGLTTTVARIGTGLLGPPIAAA